MSKKVDVDQVVKKTNGKGVVNAIKTIVHQTESDVGRREIVPCEN